MLQNMEGKGFEILIKYYNMGGGEDTKRLGSANSYNSNCRNCVGITLLSDVLNVYKRILKKRVREILDKQLEG